jgi:hypothetical protein
MVAPSAWTNDRVAARHDTVSLAAGAIEAARKLLLQARKYF